MVNIFYENTEILDFDPEFFVLWLKEVSSIEGRELGDINIICCSDEHLLTINKEYLNHDYYTDIITFDYSDSDICGDLFISVDRVDDNANELGVSFNTEFNRVVVHGVLHLLGYKDKTEEDREVMTCAENKYLSLAVSRET